MALFDEKGFIPKARRFFGGSCVGSLWCCLMKNLMRGFVLVLIKEQGSGKVLRKLDFRVMGGGGLAETEGSWESHVGSIHGVDRE